MSYKIKKLMILLCLPILLWGCGRSEVTSIALTTVPAERETTAAVQTIPDVPSESLTETEPSVEPDAAETESLEEFSHTTPTENLETTEPDESATEATPTDPGIMQDYVLNNNSKKFHYPGCSSAKQIKEENRADYHGSREELIARGYSPCGRCKP